jgi:hypothetical protein
VHIEQRGDVNGYTHQRGGECRGTPAWTLGAVTLSPILEEEELCEGETTALLPTSMEVRKGRNSLARNEEKRVPSE